MEIETASDHGFLTSDDGTASGPPLVLLEEIGTGSFFSVVLVLPRRCDIDRHLDVA